MVYLIATPGPDPTLSHNPEAPEIHAFHASRDAGSAGEAPMTNDTEHKEPADPWEKLAEFLRFEAFPDCSDLRITKTARPTGGASWETFIVSLDLRIDGEWLPRQIAIKRAPATGPLAPYLVSKDVAIFSTLAQSDVPVPALLAWTEDPSIFIRPFSVTAFIEGESHDITKVERWSVWQSQRETLGIEMIDKLAALQRVRWQDTALESALSPRGSAGERRPACPGVPLHLL